MKKKRTTQELQRRRCKIQRRDESAHWNRPRARARTKKKKEEGKKLTEEMGERGYSKPPEI